MKGDPDLDDFLTPEVCAAKAAPNFDGVITQDRIALDFAEKFAGELRYCHRTKGWYLWTGIYWRRDEKDIAFQFARELGRKAIAGAGDKALKEVRKIAFAAGVERFARGDRALAVTADAWDADPFLLGTPGGTVGLEPACCAPPIRPKASPKSPARRQPTRPTAGSGASFFLRRRPATPN
jgi:hypothetical protein